MSQQTSEIIFIKEENEKIVKEKCELEYNIVKNKID